MELSPSSSRNVGRNRPIADAAPMPPKVVKCVSGKVVVSACQPPAALSANGAAISTPSVIRMPLNRSRATIDAIPAAMVNTTTNEATITCPTSGETAPLVMMLSSRPPPMN